MANHSVIPWSWSSLSAYETCPRAFYEIRIAKNYHEDMNKDYLIWGNEVHKALENRIAHGIPLAPRMQAYEKIAAQFSAAPGEKYCEIETAVTWDFQPTGYWDSNCWSRGKDDLIIVNGTKAIDIDWKTGKPDKVTGQLSLSAARAMAKFPQVNTVHTAFAWLQNGTWSRATYTRDMLGRIWESFIERVGQMQWSENNNAWPAKPSGLCKRSKKAGSSYMGCIVASCPHSEHYRK